MKQVLAILAAAAVTTVGFAQGVVVRDTRVGCMRVTTMTPVAPAVPVVPVAVAPVEEQTHFTAADPPPRIPADAPAPAPTTADPRNQPAVVAQRDALVEAYGELAAAIRSLNPSYAIAPVISASAISAGSYYIRTTAAPYAVAPSLATTTSYYVAPDGTHVAAPVARATSYYVAPAVAPLATLPAPVTLYGHGYWGAIPSWAYTGTVRVDVPAAVTSYYVAPGKVVDARDAELTKLRDEVRSLKAAIEDMKKRMPPK